MARVYRSDKGTLSPAEEMQNGWLRVDGFAARPGILEYHRLDGTVWREYRPPEEAFREDTLESFVAVPLTNNHPASGMLDASNTKLYQIGTVVKANELDAKVRIRAVITDAATISDVTKGKVELSCGYWADVEETSGEIDGQHYDAIQRNVVINHVAIVSAGRAGPEFRLRLDSSDGVLVDSEARSESQLEGAPLKVRIDGIEVEVTDQVAQLIEKERAALAAASDAATARADAAEAALKAAKAELEAAPAKVKAELQARAQLERVAEKALGEQKFDAKSDSQLRSEVVQKVLGLSTEGRSDAYLEASFELALTQLNKAPEQTVAPIRADGVDSDNPVEVARLKFQEAARAASQRSK